MRRPTAAVGLAALLATPVLAQAQPAQDDRTQKVGPLALEHVLPDDVFAFVTFAGLDASSAAASDLELFKLLEEPEVQTFLGDLHAMVEQQFAGMPADAVQTWDVVRRQIGGRWSVALGDLTLFWADGAPIPMPSVLLALDAGDRVLEVEESLDMLLGMARAEAGDELSISSRAYRGHDVTVLGVQEDGVDFEVHLAVLDNLVLANLNGHLLDRCIDNFSTKGSGALVHDAAFARSRAHAAGEPLVEVLLDTAELASRVEGLLPIEVKQVCHDLGLDSIGSLYYASAVHDGDSFDTIYLDTPGGRRGLLAIGGDRPVDDASLAIVPADAVYCSAISLDAAKAWDAVMGAVEAIAPAEVAAEMQRELAYAEADLGFAIRDGLLAALGDEMVAYAVLPEYGFVPGVVASIELRDRAEAARILGTVMGGAGAAIRQVPHGERTLHVVTVPDADIPLSPSFAFEGDRLILGLTVGALKDALAHMDAGGPSVVESKNFQDAFRGLDRSDAGALEYIDLRTIAAFGYDLAVNMLPGYTDPDVPVDFAQLPSQDTVLRHLNGWAEVARATDEGIVVQARSISLASILALAARGLDEVPGGPIGFVMIAEAQSSQSAPVEWSDAGWDEPTYDAAPRVAEAPSAPEATPDPAPARPAPEGVVNPIAADDPRVAEFEEQIAQLTAVIEAGTEDGGVYFQRAILAGQLRRSEPAVEDYHMARELGFRPSTCAYNLACTYSLDGELDDAFVWLETAFDEGFDNWEIVGGDSDIDNMRGDERFAKLLAEYRDGAQ